MTREEHIENLKAMASDMPSDKCADWIESLMAGVKALDQKPCVDAVSRQAVIDTIDKWVKSMHVLIALPANEVTPLFESVHELPSIISQPKVGRWKRINKEKYVQHAMSYYRCSECGEEIIGKHNYCPNCGAKMENEI